MRRVPLCLVCVFVLVLGGQKPVQGASPPGPPVWVSTVPGYVSYIWVNWAYVPSATSYTVYRESPSARIKTNIGSTVSRQWWDEDAVPGVTYTYWIKACNGYGCSDYSVSATGVRLAAPAPPSNVVASDGLWPGSVGVTWDASAGSDYYVLYAYEQGAVSGSSQTSSIPQAIHYPEKTGIVYEYWAAACVQGADTYICSDLSASDTGWASGPAPAAPANVQASDGVHVGKVVVTYSLVSNAIYYGIWSSLSPSQPETSLGLSYNGVFEDTTAQPEDVTYYWVYACNMDDCSTPGTDSGWARAAPTATATPTATRTSTAQPLPSETASPGETVTPGPSRTPAATLWLPMIRRVTP